MPALRPARRRHRLLLRAGAGAALVLAASAALLLLRPAPEPYVPGRPVAGLTAHLARDLPADAPRVRFVDAAAQAQVLFDHFHGARSQQLPEDMGSGAAWCDVDADGDLDLFAVNEAGPLTARAQWPDSPAHNALFRNRGDGTFAEGAAAASLDRRALGQGAAFGDVDGDGFPDLAVSEYGPLLLYQSDAGRRFAEVAAATGVDAGERFWSGLSWADYDRDGDLDLYACAYVRYRSDPSLRSAPSRQYDAVIPASLNPSTFAPEANALFRNDEGRGPFGRHFAEVAAAAGAANPEGRSLSATFSDVDGDGWLDLYVANDLSDNVLLRNAGDGTFADVSHAAWVADYRGAMGLAAGDWDGDGDEDLFITHWIAQENALYSNMTGDFRAAGTAGAQLRFMDAADQVGLGQIALDYIGWGASFLDVDGDGRLDLLVANGSTFPRPEDPVRLAPMRPLLFWNAGPREGFYEIGAASGGPLAGQVVGRGLAVGDYDADGDPDAFLSVNGGRALLLRCEAPPAARLAVRLDHGPAWPGARIRVVAGGRSQVRQAGTGSSYLSQDAVGQELFGLGDATRADTVEVRWPDGSLTRRLDVAGGQRLTLAPEPGGAG